MTPSILDDRRLPTVLILLATYQGEAWIESQIMSVLAQKDVRVQLLIRDDGSRDGTRARVQAIAQQDTRVRLLDDHQPSGSAGGNFFRLIGVAESSGYDYVAFCDQDDEWLEDKLSSTIDGLCASGAVGGSAPVLACWADGRSRVEGQCRKLRLSDYLFEGAGQGCTFVLQADFFASVRDWLARAKLEVQSLHYHDWSVYALARATGHRWYFGQSPVLRYRQHGGNDTGARTSRAGLRRRWGLIRNGWYRAQVNSICSLVLRVNPEDPGALRWRAISGYAGRGIGGRLCRLVFVIRNGRRRHVDRVIQAAAVCLGYL